MIEIIMIINIIYAKIRQIIYIKLILIQNDYPSTGKSTLAHCFSHYLGQHGVSHQVKTLVEETHKDEDSHLLDCTRITSL